MSGTASGTHPAPASFPPVAAQPTVEDNPPSALVASFESDVPLPDSPPTTTVVNIGEPLDADNPPLETASLSGNVINIGPPMDVDDSTPDSTSIPDTVISIGPALDAGGNAGEDTDGPGITPAGTSTEIVSIGEAISADE